MADDLVQILKTLADNTRLNMVRMILTHDLCVGALAERLDVTEAAVSQHLAKLREVGLVRGEKRGYWTHYSVNRDRLGELAASLAELAALSPVPDIVGIKQPKGKTETFKEDVKMCDGKCQQPEKLIGIEGICSPRQIATDRAIRSLSDGNDG